MRLPSLFSALAALLFVSVAHAGRLDLAVLQFTDARNLDEVAAALKTVDLAKVTDSDRTETSVPGLRGGWVVFTQSLGVGAGSFGNSTRLSNQRADVSGSLQGSNLSVKITILEGVKVGLRKYEERTYTGEGSVAGGYPQIVGVRQSKGKTQEAIKGRSRIVETEFTTLVIARYRP